MEILKIMEPKQSRNMKSDGIMYDENLYLLKINDLEKYQDNVPIVDEAYKIIGEIKKELLDKTLRTEPLDMITNILDFLPTGIVAIDTKGIVFYANKEYAKLLGKPLKEIIGNCVNNLTVHSAIMSAAKTGEKIAMEKRYLETIGKNVSGLIYPIFIKKKLRGAVSIFSDTTIEELKDRVEEVRSEVIYLRQQLKLEKQKDSIAIVGQSHVFLRLIEKATIVAETDVPVLIRGENGVGKEVLAKFIHDKSSRSNKPFVVVNCAAIPENLIESELFGYEAGSFTGAKSKGKTGKFELANGGTLFLDEIGDMSVAMQTKLLRALQNKEIEKIGSEKMESVDVRVISATNQPLDEMIDDKTFRRDLFYRINTVTLMVPPLRERKEDIVLFLNHFLKQTNMKYGKDVRLADNVFALLCQYEWPGNVRELKNFIENAVIMCESGYYDKNAIMDYFGNSFAGAAKMASNETEESPFVPMTLKQALAEAERKIIIKTLKAHSNNRTAAMQTLGLSRRTFYRKLNEHALL